MIQSEKKTAAPFAPLRSLEQGHVLQAPSPSKKNKASALNVVLLEILPTDPTRNYRSEYYPFIAGLLKGLGVRVCWLCIGVEVIKAVSGENRFVYDLSPEDRRRTENALGEIGPTHVLLNERLDEELWMFFRSRLRQVSFRLSGLLNSRTVLSLLEDWLGVDVSNAKNGGLLEENVVPDYGKTALNDLARGIRPFVRIRAGNDCNYYRGIADNPHFKNLNPAGMKFNGGCSFCYRPEAKNFAFRRSSAAGVALAQVLAWERTGNPDINDRVYMVDGSEVYNRLEEFFDGILKSGVPASTFMFSCRVDQVLRNESTLRAVLLRLEGTGHVINIWNIGIENFSIVENERFNKGLEPEVIERFFCVSRKIAERHPETFHFDPGDDCGVILFTPWTTLEDLRVNIRAFRRHRFTPEGFFLGSALQLRMGLPITKLAEQQGFVLNRHDDLPVDSGCISEWDETELPWRFKHPETATAFYFMRRTTNSATDVIPADDEALVLIREWMARMIPKVSDRYTLIETLLDVLEAEPEVRSILGVLQRMERRLGAVSELLAGHNPTGEVERLDGLAEVVKPLLRRAAAASEMASLWARIAEAIMWNYRRNPKVQELLRDHPLESIRASTRDGPTLEVELGVGRRRRRICIRERTGEVPSLFSDGPLVLYYSGKDAPLLDEEKRVFRHFLRLVRQAHGSLSRSPAPHE